MEIVIENDPYRPSSTSPGPTYLRSPQQPPVVSTNNAFYFATLPRGGGGARVLAETQLDGAPTTSSVRRVDKSGLLEIADIEPTMLTGRQTPAGGTHCGTLSRRLDRPILLEAVPEVPDQCAHRHSGLISDELMAAAATARSMVERQQHLLGAETDVVESSLLRRRSFANESQDSSSSISVQTDVESLPSTKKTTRVKFAMDEIPPPMTTTVIPPPPLPSTNLDEIKELKEPKKNSVVDCLARLSPRQRSDSRQQPTLSNIPDVIEAHGTVTPAGTTTTISSTITRPKKEAPQGERAEAEGCEHTTIDSVESYKNSGGGTNTKLPGHNDNLQAVHVIILSEQL